MMKFNNFSLFSLLLIIAIIFQIILGAIVRITDSGLACPDWPLCYGLWLPTKDKIQLIENINFSYIQILLEWFHRANAAAIVGPLTIILLLKSLFQNAYKKYRFFTIIIFCVVIVQSLIGGFTVFDKNSAWSVALHLSLALIFVFLTISMIFKSLKIQINIYNTNSKREFIILIISISLVFLTMLLGAIVSKSGASLACANWPICNEKLIPSSIEYLEFIHILHRIFAIFSVISIIYFSFVYKFYENNFYIKIIYILPSLLIILQILLGALVIFSSVNILTAVLHQVTALFLFLILSILISLNLYTINQQKI